MLRKFAISTINFYQNYLSFDKGLLMFLAPTGSCIYSPTCSEYTKQMIVKEGIVKGSLLGMQRIISCR